MIIIYIKIQLKSNKPFKNAIIQMKLQLLFLFLKWLKYQEKILMKEDQVYLFQNNLLEKTTKADSRLLGFARIFSGCLKRKTKCYVIGPKSKSIK